jgi:hypothetical protein
MKMMSEPPRRPLRAVSLRLKLSGIAAVSLVFAAGKQALKSWDYQHRMPASEKLLQPLIEFHGLQADGYRLLEREELRLARSRSKRLGEESRLAARSVFRIGLPYYRVPPEIEGFCKYLSSLAAHSPRQQGPTVLENFQTSVWSGRMAIYHTHIKAYYEELLSELWTELPPTPPALEEELKARTAELQRIRRNPTVDLYLETAPHLLPGAPQPKPPVGGDPDSQSY